MLYTDGVYFKTVTSLDRLNFLNHGFDGLSQIGKFLTVYPGDDAQAVRLATLLDKATRGLRGPAIPSDHSLSAHSLVSYRYGGYREQLMHTSSGGTIEPALRAPSGELVPDVRYKTYKAFDWVNDPFVAAGIADNACKEAPILISKRYLIISPLYESARGGTYLAVDTTRLRSCVLKRAGRNACLDLEGKDARDALRHEASILAILAPDPCFPELYDFVEQGDDWYLVMEEIQGETLEKYATRSFALGSLGAELVVTWGRELAAILGKIHAQGLVYCDLKPSNVMVTPDKKLRLIDFGFVLAQGEQQASSRVGTRGYMSPQHMAGEPAGVADDIYSLGALLYNNITRAKPSTAPDPSNLLARPLVLLNPALSSSFIQVITTCLDLQPEKRFLSMQALDMALAACMSKAEIAPPAFGCESLTDSHREASLRYRALARRLGDTLCQAAQRQPERPGVFWLSSHQLKRGVKARAVYTGCSGSVLALAEVVAELNDPAHRSVLAEGAQWLIHNADTIANPIPGLYVGEAGVGTALLRASQVLDDEALLDAAIERSRWVSSQPYDAQDLMNGAAGRLRFHLWLWDETHDAEHLRAALDAGRWLISVAEDAGQGTVCWNSPLGKAYPGYAHGVAGIADALLDLFEATGDEYFLSPVAGANRLLERLAVPVLADRSGLNWPTFVDDHSQDLAGIFWCHGASGIGRFFLHASELDLLPQAARLAARAARAVARCSRWTSPIQCHGLSGSIEFLLDMFQATGDQHYSNEARSLATLLETFSTEQDGMLVWPSDNPFCFTPDYMVGYAGVLVCLLRLAAPERLPHQLSRRGFHHAPTHENELARSADT